MLNLLWLPFLNFWVSDGFSLFYLWFSDLFSACWLISAAQRVWILPGLQRQFSVVDWLIDWWWLILFLHLSRFIPVWWWRRARSTMCWVSWTFQSTFVTFASFSRRSSAAWPRSPRFCWRKSYGTPGPACLPPASSPSCRATSRAPWPDRMTTRA